MKNKNITTNNLLAEISEQVELCDGKQFPILCNMRATASHLELLIYNIIVSEGVSISEAMAQIEQSFSLNATE